MITFSEFYQAHAERLWQGKHLRETKAKLKKFSEFNGFGDRPMDSFKPQDFYDFVDLLKEEGKTDNTVNHYGSALSKTFSHAVFMQTIEFAPQWHWLKVKSGRPRYMTDDELDQLQTFLAGHQNSWMQHFVTIALNTGMRKGEIRQIGKTAFLSDDKEWLTLPETKNGDERIVPISPETLAAIEALDGVPDKYYSHRKFYATWGQARRKIAKGDQTFVFHVLRHTCATTMANDLQINSHLIGQMLGHRSEATTRKYVHAKPENLLSIAKKLSNRR